MTNTNSIPMVPRPKPLQWPMPQLVTGPAVPTQYFPQPWQTYGSAT